MKVKEKLLNVLAIIIVAAVTLEFGWAVYNSPTHTLMGVALLCAAYCVVWLVVWAFRRAFRMLPEKDEPNEPKWQGRAVGGVMAIIVAAAMLVTGSGRAQSNNYSSGGYTYGTYNYTPTYSYNQGTSFSMNNNANYDGTYQTWGQTMMGIFSDPFSWAAGIGGMSKMFDRSEDPGHAWWKSGSGRMPSAQP